MAADLPAAPQRRRPASPKPIPARWVPMPLPLVLVLAVALVDEEGRVLMAQRPAGKSMAGLWEFPGGKVEPSDRPEQSLARELREELGIAVSEGALQPFAFASHGYGTFHLLQQSFGIAFRAPGRVEASAASALMPSVPHLQPERASCVVIMRRHERQSAHC